MVESYGLKVSKPGFSVFDADDEDLIYSSKFKGWKILAKGSISIGGATDTVAHGLSFEPAALVFQTYTDAEANSGNYLFCGFDQSTTSTGGAQGTVYWTDSTNLNIDCQTTETGYYFILVDPAEDATGSATDQQDYGIKVSTTGNNVLTAEDTDLSLTSRFKTFKEETNGTANVTIAADTINGAHTAAVTTITVNSTAGFDSSGVIWIEEAGLGTAEAVAYTGTTATTFTGCTRGYWGSTATTHATNDRVRTAYGKADVSHSLGYPPAFSVFYNESGGNARQVPHFLANALPTKGTCLAFTDNNTLKIRIEMDDPTIAPDWNIDGTYPFRYYIFKDSIT